MTRRNAELSTKNTKLCGNVVSTMNRHSLRKGTLFSPPTLSVLLPVSSLRTAVVCNRRRLHFDHPNLLLKPGLGIPKPPRPGIGIPVDDGVWVWMWEWVWACTCGWWCISPVALAELPLASVDPCKEPVAAAFDTAGCAHRATVGAKRAAGVWRVARARVYIAWRMSRASA